MIICEERYFTHLNYILHPKVKRPNAMVLPKFENSGNKYKKVPTQPAFTSSKLTKETLKQGVKYLRVNNKDTRTTPLALLTLNM